MKKSAGFIGSLLAFVGIFVGVPWLISSSSQPPPEPVCATEPISYEKIEEEDPNYDEDSSYIKQDGREGERRICTLNGAEVSNEATVEPINEIRVQGTKPPPDDYYEPAGSYRTGATCNDGSYSPATGRGACSWHGGVSEWLYN